MTTDPPHGPSRRSLVRTGSRTLGAALLARWLAAGGPARAAPASPPRGGFITIDGIETYYEEVLPAGGGAGAVPLVLIGDWSLNLESWRPQMERLGARGRVVSYDWRGMGRSGGGDTNYDLAHLARDLASLLEQLDLGHPVLAGHGTGGAIALQYAVEHPEGLRGLVLAGHAPQTADQQARDLADLARFESALARGGLEGTVPQVEERFFSAAFRAQQPGALERWRVQYLTNSPEALVKAWFAVAHRPVRTPEQLARVTVPVLLLAGDQDAAVSMEAAQQSLALLGGVPGGARLAVLPSGHLTLVEKPETVNVLLEAFLRLEGLDG